MKRNLLVLLITCYTFIAYSQSGIIWKETDSKGNVVFAEFNKDSVEITKESGQILKKLHALGEDEEFILTDSRTDNLGFTHLYFNQYYKGIRVAYLTYSLHGKNNEISTANGTYNRVDYVNTVAELTEKEALACVIRFVSADMYKWEVPEEELWLKEYYNESFFPNGELVIIMDRLKTNQQFRLAWKFDLYAHIPLSRNLIYVDAITGDILDTESKIYHVNSPGTAATRYSGTRNIVADSFTGGFQLRETRNNVRIETYNMRNQSTNYSGAPNFVDNDNNWSAVEFNNLNMDNAALDAHWGAEMVYEYFSTVHGRNSWDEAGGPLLSYVHTNLTAFGLLNNVNAFWDGQRITYGDGDFCFDPLTSLDIVAHEIAHGINSTSARMRYDGESGALNESLSDIWAACVEFWAAPGKQTWLNGEDITLCSNAFRSMSNPNLYGQPDTYFGINWFNTIGCTTSPNNDNCGVHTNSGVPNFWFFLLVNGGMGTNDNTHDYFVDGIDISRAARIIYRAETVILASSNEQFVTFNQFRNATITAASNLYGANSLEVISVTNAWHAVGVGDRYHYSISGPSVICNQGTYYINNLPQGATVSWSSSNTTKLALTSGQGTSTANFNKINNGKCNVNANISIGGNNISLTKAVSVGVPDRPWISNGGITSTFSSVDYTLCIGQGTTSLQLFFIQSINSAEATSWEVTKTFNPSNFSIVNNGNNIFVTPNQTGTGQFTVKAVNSCGVSTVTTVNLTINTCGGGGGIDPPGWPIDFSMYSNPASEIVTIEVFEQVFDTIQNVKRSDSYQNEYTIQLRDTQGVILRNITKKQPKAQISLRGIPSGMYYVHLIVDNQIVQKKILWVK